VEAVPPEVLLVMDEAYFEFLEDPLDLLPYVRGGAKPNLLLMRTFSKIYGLAGLRLGYGLGHPALIAAMEKVRQPFNINALAQAGALAALEDEEHLRRTRKNNLEGLAFFEKACREQGWGYVPSSANFILIKVGEGQKVFQELQHAGVIVRPMGGYGLPAWIRVSIGTPEENARCVRAMKEIMG
jgi:histidinol-phosphate aminotransferase